MIPFLWNVWKSRQGSAGQYRRPTGLWPVPRVGHPMPTAGPTGQSGNSDAGSKLAAALRGAPVAFEADGVDQDHQVGGWSVVVRGRAEEITDEDKLAELRRTPLLAWHPEPNPAIYESTLVKSSADASRSPTLPRIGRDSSRHRPTRRLVNLAKPSDSATMRCGRDRTATGSLRLEN
jgi:hypothetical protein